MGLPCTMDEQCGGGKICKNGICNPGPHGGLHPSGIHIPFLHTFPPPHCSSIVQGRGIHILFALHLNPGPHGGLQPTISHFPFLHIFPPPHCSSIVQGRGTHILFALHLNPGPHGGLHCSLSSFSIVIVISVLVPNL